MRVQVDINRINFRSGDKLDLPVSLWVDGRTAEDSGYIFGNLRLKHDGKKVYVEISGSSYFCRNVKVIKEAKS